MSDLVFADLGDTAIDESITSVVTGALYQSLTGDTTSDGADVAVALLSAQRIVEEYLRRPLGSDERTETLRLASNGRVYPAATPITAVSSPSTATILDGQAIYSVTSDAGPTWPGTFEASTFPAEVTVTYTGGFTGATLPRTIAAVIASLAYGLLHADDTSDLPAGATAASVGDVSVSFGDDTNPGAELDDAQKLSVRPWRRRFV